MDNHNNHNEQIPNGDLENENGDLENGDLENGDSDVENETPYVNHNSEPRTPQKNSENQSVYIEDRDVNKVLQETFIRASITKNDGKNETSRVLFNKLLSVDIQQDDLIKTLKRGLYYLSAYSKDHELVGQITDILIRN